MFNRSFVLLGGAIISFVTLGTINFAQRPATSRPATSQRTSTPSATPRRTSTATATSASTAPAMTLEAENAMVKQYCSGCHNDKLKTGDMSLTQIDLAHPEKNPELAEKMIRKLRVGVMPPAGNPRPPVETAKAFVATLESAIDKNAALNPNPGRRPFQRLTRTEYARSVRDLLDIDVDVAAL